MTNTEGHDVEYLAIVRPQLLTDGSVAGLAHHPDLPGCVAHADTPEEALVNLAEARAMVLRHLREHGIEPPAPGSSKLAKEILAAV